MSESTRALGRAQFRMTIRGDETAWVAGVHGALPIVELGLDQLHLVGTLTDLRERLGALIELLNDLEENPHRWSEISAWEQVGPKHHRRTVPNPFVRRPDSKLDPKEPQ